MADCTEEHPGARMPPYLACQPNSRHRMRTTYSRCIISTVGNELQSLDPRLEIGNRQDITRACQLLPLLWRPTFPPGTSQVNFVYS